MSTIVLDPGTGTWKCGVATESLPSVVVPTVCGLPSKTRSLLKRKTDAAAESDAPASNKTLFGEDALSNAGKCQISFPMSRGAVENWDDIEQLFHHCITELEIEDIEGSSIVVAVPPYNSRDCTERFAAMCMETFEMSRIAIVQSGMCALYSAGRTSGIVLDSGEGVTSIMPLYDSFPLIRSVNRLNWGGSDVTEHMRRLLYERGFSFSSAVDEWQVRLIKEKLGYVSEDYQKELTVSQAEEKPEDLVKEFDLPDGQALEVGSERFRAPEILFNPGIVQLEHPTMSQFVAETIKSCDIDVRMELAKNIVLSGGNTMFPGFADRVRLEVAQAFPGMFNAVNVIAPPERRYLVFSGGTVIATLDSFEPLWVTKETYQENGPTIVHGYRRKDDDEDE